jgi:osmotically-inducible protein OsmY
MADYDRFRGYDRDVRHEDRQGSRNTGERGGFGSHRDTGYYARGADYGRRDEDGYIARRGFGNERSGYGRGGDQGDWSRSSGNRSGESDWRSQGYGRGGRDMSARDRFYGSNPSGGESRWSGGESRWSGGNTSEGRWSREHDFGDPSGAGTSRRGWRDTADAYRTAYGDDPVHERGFGGDYGRTGSSRFGRGSRDDDEERGFFERAGDEVRSWFGDEDAERRREYDMGDNRYGEHRGRGPRNYARSDDRIRDDVNDRLTDDPHVDASDIDVSVSNREVTLSGHVKSRFAKRHAEDIAESVSGVTHVQNNLRVQQPAEGDATAGSGSGAMGTTASTDSTGSTLSGTASTTGRRRSSSTAGT